MEQERNRREQAEIYGESLDGVFGRIGSSLGLTQAQLAGVIGMSPPMLSQLVTGRRIKIGNPAVLQRLMALQELAEQVEAGAVDSDQVSDRLAEVRSVTGQWTLTQPQSRTSEPPRGAETAVPEGIRGLLRTLASGQDLHAAVRLLSPTQPALARFLQVYGLDGPEEAAEHYRAHRKP
ncbi:helix-turn-helix domain-containing protein [Ornithinicoccus hortensis]|uniref:HTH cro/C1-type domain-containing protein n=1 Tax=Ornithinicoccus hortensis TaxID=82346 RepID=A0A542YN00_9MICO|nr:helix-turn-helix transcriptional regulator [Ornithinicoccus hortensis]TQL49476.1 hypothetical protein FB467_0549 [Ornithinicoccus hortensis]